MIPSIFTRRNFPLEENPLQTITHPPPNLMVGVRQQEMYRSPICLRTYVRLFEPKISNLLSSANRTLPDCSWVQSTCSFANFSLFAMFWGRSKGFFAPTRPFIPTLYRTRRIVDWLTGFGLATLNSFVNCGTVLRRFFELINKYLWSDSEMFLRFKAFELECCSSFLRTR